MEGRRIGFAERLLVASSASPLPRCADLTVRPEYSRRPAVDTVGVTGHKPPCRNGSQEESDHGDPPLCFLGNYFENPDTCPGGRPWVATHGIEHSCTESLVRWRTVDYRGGASPT